MNWFFICESFTLMETNFCHKTMAAGFPVFIQQINETAYD